MKAEVTGAAARMYHVCITYVSRMHNVCTPSSSWRCGETGDHLAQRLDLRGVVAPVHDVGAVGQDAVPRGPGPGDKRAQDQRQGGDGTGPGQQDQIAITGQDQSHGDTGEGQQQKQDRNTHEAILARRVRRGHGGIVSNRGNCAL